MATKLENIPDQIKVVSKSIVDTGEIKIPRKTANEYKAELWEAFAYWIGKKIVSTYEDKMGERPCTILFFPPDGDSNLYYLAKRQDTNSYGEKMISPLFTISYDENQQITECHKNKQNIPTKMRIIITC